ncbi:ABC transporter ATP-binding protein/permease [Desulfovibrio sp. OttesenSCG-928-M14]|nr:ABC transporter ATP-binding protein/permease [Desulfovibrio sp. OttesenSCG-928-M14]
MDKIRALYRLFWLNFKRIYIVLPGFLRKKCLLAFVGMAFLAALEVATMVSISFLGMSIAAPEAAMSFGFMPYLIDNYPAAQQFFADPRNVAMFGSCYVVGLMALKNLTTYLIQYFTTYLGEMAALDLGKRLFNNYLHRNYIDFLSGTSSYIYNMIGMRSAVGQYMVACMNVYTYFFAFIALVILVLGLTPSGLFLVLSLVGAISMFIYLSVKQSLDHNSKQILQHSLEESKSLSNALGGVREIIIYQQQDAFLNVFIKSAAAKIKPQTILSISPTIPTLILETVGFLAIPCIVVVLVYWYSAPMADIASTLMLVMLFCWRVLPMLNRSLSHLVVMRTLQTPAFTCLAEVEKLEAAVEESQAALRDNTFHINEKIALENISFLYPGREQCALEGVSCEATLGRKIGIVGLSGAGKSTLAGILSGLIMPTDGQLLVDGKTLTPEVLLNYRQRIGYVPQAAFIMEGTLAQNIAFSEWGKPIDMQRVAHAAELAALDFINSTPQGLEMQLSASGQLSGGQMQRVSIARALYVAPQVLIFDESTSSLDLATESAILQTIASLPDDLIVFVIAHRLSTVEHCDEIWWLDGGRLRKRGPVSEVLPEYTTYLAACSAA